MASHNDVAHNWAHQTGRARKGFNMFYEGTTIFSYGHHFPIASFVEAPNGERVCLFNDDHYSPSTSKHQTYTRRALPSGVRVLDVPSLERCLGYSRLTGLATLNSGGYSEHGMREVWEAMFEGLPAMALKVKRARSNKDWRLMELERRIDTLNTLNTLFNLGFGEVQQDADFVALGERMEAERKAQAEAAAKERAKRDAKAIKDWQEGAEVRPPHTATPFVRVKGDTLETSWGIKVPLDEALEVFKVAGACRKEGRTYSRPEGFENCMRAGSWPIDAIDAKGNIRAGCHLIPFEASMKAATLAGLLQDA